VDLLAEAVPQGVKLTWRMPQPRPEARFRIYRKSPKEQEASLAARAEAAQWVDQTAVFGETYEYSLQATLAETESVVSPAVSITPLDIFPPAVPRGLSAVASPATIELNWERNTEADLRGYRVYRSDDGGEPGRIAGLIETPACSDRAIRPGQRYRYSVTSVDQRGNESAPSEAVEVVNDTIFNRQKL
jgi:fibronectin type 3 domain-containing protein